MVERATLGRTGTLRIADAAPFEVMISDLTRDGCRIETEANLAPNSDVQVGIAHIGLTAGRIVWRGSAGYGCRFDQPLPAGVVTSAFGASNVTSFPLVPPTVAARTVKVSPRITLAILAAISTIGWGGVVMLAMALRHG